MSDVLYLYNSQRSNYIEIYTSKMLYIMLSVAIFYLSSKKFKYKL